MTEHVTDEDVEQIEECFKNEIVQRHRDNYLRRLLNELVEREVKKVFQAGFKRGTQEGKKGEAHPNG